MATNRTQQFTDVFILMLSGAAEVVNGREVRAIEDHARYHMTVEFLDNSPIGKVIYRGYWKNGGVKIWESEYVNGVKNGTYTSFCNDGSIKWQELYIDGKFDKVLV